MSEAQAPLSQVVPGPLVAQRNAIVALLQRAFPPSRFQFKDMPSRLDKAAWRDLTQGNQPLLGLGFNGIKSGLDSYTFMGAASWSLLVAVRAQGTPKQRFLGDAQRAGVLTIAPVAVAMLQGQVAGTGTITVTSIDNVMSEEWGDDCAVIQLGLSVGVRLPLYDAVSQPAELGLFQEMAAQWMQPTPLGNSGTAQSFGVVGVSWGGYKFQPDAKSSSYADTETSDWKNPSNGAAADD